MYRFASKYGANVDGYSPIYTPDTWAEGGWPGCSGTPAVPCTLAAMPQLRGAGAWVVAV